MKKMTLALMTLVSITALGDSGASDCADVTSRLEKALKYAAYGSKSQSKLTFEGADEAYHFTLAVSNPEGKYTMVYTITLDNDSPERCSVIDISLK